MFAWLRQMVTEKKRQDESRLHDGVVKAVLTRVPNARVLGTKGFDWSGGFGGMAVSGRDCYVVVRVDDEIKVACSDSGEVPKWVKERVYKVRAKDEVSTFAGPDAPREIASWYFKLTIEGFQNYAHYDDEVI